MSRFRRKRLAVRAQPWGQFMVVVVRGELNAANRQALTDCVLKVQGTRPVILDLSGAPRCDPGGIAAIREVKELLEDQAWAFAVVADPSRQCARALGNGPDPIATYPDRHAARSALHHVAL
jgi:anti-anti-sigma regulatory factor